MNTDSTQPDAPRTALVLGGGLAGIAAAVRLADAGVRVTLIESKNRLGGRATSFVDAQSGQVLDNCQHVLMGCCTNLLDLYDRLGVTGCIEWHDRFNFIDAAGRHDVLKGDRLPSPMHLGRSLMGFTSLSMRDKLGIVRAMYAMMRLGPGGRAAWHDKSFGDWLRQHKQTPNAIEKFWGNVIVSALNEQVDDAAADYALQVFQDGFLAHRDAFRMGLASTPLVELYDAAQGVIENANGRVLMPATVKSIEFDGARIAGVTLGDGQSHSADHYINALPFERLSRVIDDAMRNADERLRIPDNLQHSPILGIHLWLKRSDADDDAQAVMPLPHVALTQSPLHWVFNKGYDETHDAQHLHGVISAAYDLVDQSAESIIDMATAEIKNALPSTRSASVVHARVIKEKLATFACRAGVDAHRPAAAGAIDNLFLAGDWCRSGWPATMEGAVRSGYLAAAAAQGQDASAALCNDLPRSRLCRWLAKG